MASITWESLEKYTTAFHTLSNGQSIELDVLLDSSSTSNNNHPVIIVYHGGGLIMGGRDQYETMSPWLPSYAAASNAIIVSPDHRLLPKAAGREVRHDVEALWEWVLSSLNGFLLNVLPGHTADFSRILVCGSSSGGFGSAHLALSYPGQIRAAILVYPFIDGFHERGEVEQTLFPPDAIPSKEESSAWIGAQEAANDWVLNRKGELKPLLGLFQDQAAFSKAFGSDDDLSPAYRAARADEAKGIPERVWIVHGRGDSIIPVHYSQNFFEALRSRGWESSARLTIIEDPPNEHGCDHGWEIDNDNLAPHLAWINESWLK